jgi:DMSO/TMAO reductase YedYZ molybdopterin-dependent catalytic subunit
MTDKTIIYSPDMSRENRIPPGQQLVTQWPVLQHDNIYNIDINKWRIKIFGQVKNEIEMDFQEFSSLPQVIVHSDIHCVTGWSKLDNVWQGPASGTIFDMASVSSSAAYVIIHAAGGFTTNLTLSDFLENDVLFTLKYNGETLTPEHGYPVRLIVPRLYLWKSAKWVDGIEFTTEDKPGFWETSGYHNHGDPWKEERYSY